MAHHDTRTTHLDEQREWTRPTHTFALGAVGVGILAAAFFLARASEEGVRRFWFAYLVSFAYLQCISLGALFFVLLQHLTRSGWSVVVRRPAEALACNLGLMAVLFLPILGMVLSNSGQLYHWAQAVPEHPAHAHAAPSPVAGPSDENGLSYLLVADTSGGHGDTAAVGGIPADPAHSPAGHTSGGPGVGKAHGPGGHGHDAHGHGGLDELTLKKRAYLNPTFFTVRWILFYALWIGLAVYFWRQSLLQDHQGGTIITLRLQSIAAPAMLAFGLSFTFAAFDLLMSLDAHWFSTIFGVYIFAGAAVTFFACLIVVLHVLQRQGMLTASITTEHYHDLGKFLFGFTFFWGYIAFSQYMLIWYGNLPEETGWFLRRGVGVGAELANVWSPIILLVLFGCFLLPFPGLLSRHVKRDRKGLLFWAVWLLVFHWIHTYWIVMPELTTAHRPILVELLCLAGLGVLYVAGLRAILAAGRQLLPVGDPRLGESLAFHNI